MERLEDRRLLASFAFADSLGGGPANEVSVEAAQVDASGATYITGSFSGTVPFGATTLTSRGAQNIFVAKLDRMGGVAWAVRMGSADPGGGMGGLGRGLALDPAGNPVVTGFFSGVADFGKITLTSSGQDDIFVEKLDKATGRVIWADGFGGAASDAAQSVAVAPNGNIYVTGSYQGAASFGPAGVLNAADGSSAEIFVAALAPQGTAVWATSLGGMGQNSGYGIAVDRDSNAYVTGNFTGQAPFGQDITLQSAGDSDIFVTRLSSSGVVDWAVAEGGVGHDDGTAITVDASGDVYATGDFVGTAQFGGVSLTTVGQDDAFVQRLDGASGRVAWAQGFGGTGFDAGFGIAVDGAGNVYSTGVFQNTISFGGTTITSHGDSDAYLAELDPNGAAINAFGFGSTAGDQAYQVAVGGPGSAITLVGSYGAGFTFMNHALSAMGSGYVIQLALPSATHLAVAAPGSPVASGTPFTVSVNALDSFGNIDPVFQGSVTLSLATNPGDGTLGGTLVAQATNGVATFNGLILASPGTGYTLGASSGALSAGTSVPFDVSMTAKGGVKIDLISSAPASVYGQSLTFTATVSGTPGQPAPTGTIQFEAEGRPFGSAVLLINGAATTPSLATLHAGTHSITALYSGDARYQDLLSPGTSLTVSPAPLVVTAIDVFKPFGQPVPALTASYGGFVNGDGPSSLTTPVTLFTTATATSAAGLYPIVAGGASSPDYTITYVAGSLTVPSLVPGADPGPVAFVTTLYREVLGRAPTSQDLSYWVGRLAAGTSPGTVARSVFGSAERLTLQREHKAPAISLKTALADAQWAMRLARVPPASLPNPGRIALVTTLYREILNRALDPASQIYRLQELATGVSPAAVAREIFDSPEHRTLQRQRKAPRISLRTAIRDALKAERTASGLTS